MNKIEKNKIAFELLFCLVFVVLTIPIASAIGITPGRTSIYFEPNLEKQVEFKLINNEHKEMKVAFYVEGALNETTRLEEKEAFFKASEEEKTFSYSFKLPERLEPGFHETRIVAMEIPSEALEEEIYIKATIAVATQLHVIVPYPGKYLETELIVEEQDNKTKFIFFAHNLGTESIKDAYVKIEVVDKKNKLIANLETTHAPIKSKERKEFISEWKAEQEGKYYVKATIFYNGQSKKEEQWFTAGKAALELVSITVKDFKLGQVAKFTVLVKNKWDEQVNASARLLIFDSGTQITDLTGNSVIAASSYGTLNIYWDTENVEAKDYDSKFTLQYEKESLEKLLKIKVKADKIDVEVLGITAAVVAEEGKKGLNFLLTILIIILILANAAWWLYFRKRKNKLSKI